MLRSGRAPERAALGCGEEALQRQPAPPLIFHLHPGVGTAGFQAMGGRALRLGADLSWGLVFRYLEQHFLPEFAGCLV